MVSIKKVGGLTFIRIGSIQISVCRVGYLSKIKALDCRDVSRENYWLEKEDCIPDVDALGFEPHSMFEDYHYSTYRMH